MNKRLYAKVKHELEQRIAVMEANQRLPSRNALIRQYSVTRTTIDRAIAELTAEGRLYSHKGSGTYVAEKSGAPLQNASRSIGIVLPNIQDYNYPGILRGVLDVAEKRSQNVIISNTDDLIEKQKRNIEQLIDANIKGLIIIPVSSDIEIDSYKSLQRHKIPFVFVNRPITGIMAPLSTQNNFYGAYLATEYFIQTGHTTIAFISRTMHMTNKERFHGYLAALHKYGISFDRSLVYFESPNGSDLPIAEKNTGTKAMKHLLQTNAAIDAVLCTNDRIALNALTLALGMGIRVPDDISFFGFDNSDICEISPVKLSSVSFDRYTIGVNAANLLLNKLDYADADGFEILTTMPEIVIRESVGKRA